MECPFKFPFCAFSHDPWDKPVHQKITERLELRNVGLEDDYSATVGLPTETFRGLPQTMNRKNHWKYQAETFIFPSFFHHFHPKFILNSLDPRMITDFLGRFRSFIIFHDPKWQSFRVSRRPWQISTSVPCWLDLFVS